MNRELKARIVLNGLRQVSLAAMTGIGEKRISEFICERSQPSDDEKLRIAQALGVDVSALFPPAREELAGEITRHVAELVNTNQGDVVQERPDLIVNMAETTFGFRKEDKDEN